MDKDSDPILQRRSRNADPASVSSMEGGCQILRDSYETYRSEQEHIRLTKEIQRVMDERFNCLSQFYRTDTMT